ncbi:heteromeric transposase endonuclease subunit TnsA [Clostridium sp. PL3]|uniref:Heteromeric transposase endonuclease subunit TnsA n=1 Tax=Clostridium thailandense TaxID=2794346 RepID=A0A949TU05_9CLOT|nr:TnsA endonuclease C-terminal domain-containing protein [Clostridium thailandense]MBV7276467.1 heteromeric transposase endonuclease subunit TnsA [Clostridium thailandense]
MSLKVTTFSSKGRVTRIFGYKTKRIHHLQSDNQLRVFLLLEWNDIVKNIEENVEIKDLEIIIDNVEDLRLDKFSDNEGQLYQLHTNFLVTTERDNVEEQIAISVKSLSEIERRTVIEKIEIERRFWRAKGIRFYVVTEKEINKQLVDNIKWVRETLIDKNVENKRELAEHLYYFLQENKQEKLSDVLGKFDDNVGAKKGTALFIFRYLIGIKEIVVDMEKSIDLNETISILIKF